jgi:hypothetical protein
MDLLEELETIINNCPEPKNPRCSCPSHEYFSVKSDGNLNWIKELNRGEIFRLKTFAPR